MAASTTLTEVINRLFDAFIDTFDDVRYKYRLDYATGIIADLRVRAEIYRAELVSKVGDLPELGKVNFALDDGAIKEALVPFGKAQVVLQRLIAELTLFNCAIVPRAHLLHMRTVIRRIDTLVRDFNEARAWLRDYLTYSRVSDVRRGLSLVNPAECNPEMDVRFFAGLDQRPARAIILVEASKPMKSHWLGSSRWERARGYLVGWGLAGKNAELYFYNSIAGVVRQHTTFRDAELEGSFGSFIPSGESILGDALLDFCSQKPPKGREIYLIMAASLRAVDLERIWQGVAGLRFGRTSGMSMSFIQIGHDPDFIRKIHDFWLEYPDVIDARLGIGVSGTYNVFSRFSPQPDLITGRANKRERCIIRL